MQNICLYCSFVVFLSPSSQMPGMVVSQGGQDDSNIRLSFDITLLTFVKETNSQLLLVCHVVSSQVTVFIFCDTVISECPSRAMMCILDHRRP